MSENQATEANIRHCAIEICVDGEVMTSHSHRLTGRQIRELGGKNRAEGYKTEIASGHVRVIGDHEEVEVHNGEHFRSVIEVYLDGDLVVCRSKHMTGLQIRELGSEDRVDGFETQEINAHGKKVRTIGDAEQTDVYEHERFRTVPNHGGPGAAF